MICWFDQKMVTIIMYVCCVWFHSICSGCQCGNSRMLNMRVTVHNYSAAHIPEMRSKWKREEEKRKKNNQTTINSMAIPPFAYILYIHYYFWCCCRILNAISCKRQHELRWRKHWWRDFAWVWVNDCIRVCVCVCRT